MKRTRPIFAFSLAALAGGCETPDATYAVIDNMYPVPTDAAEQTVVYKGWWRVTEFPDPVAAGASSDEERVIRGSDIAYLLLAPSWDPMTNVPPSVLIPVHTRDEVSVRRGDRLHIVASDAMLVGNCAAGAPLTQPDADFITQRIFPEDFAGFHYDAATCTRTREEGSDAGSAISAFSGLDGAPAE